MEHLWINLAWLLAAVGFAVGLWALLWDRAKGRTRCPKCWYDLTGIPRLTPPDEGCDSSGQRLRVCTCPECGHGLRSESRMYRTRRRWRWAALGFLLALAGVGGAQWPTIRDRGAWSFAPLFVLEQFLPLPDEERTWDPITSNWIMHPVAKEMGSRLDHGAFTRVNWAHVICSTGIMKARKRWPMHVPYAISMEVPAWAGPTEIKLIPRVPGWRPATAGTLIWESCGNAAWAREAAQQYQELGILQPSMTEIVFDVTVSTHEQRDGRWSSARGPVIVCTTTLHVPVEPVSSYEHALTPVSDSRLDHQILQSLRVSRHTNSNAKPGVWTSVGAIQPLSLSGDEFLEFGASLEVLRDGAVMESQELDRSDGWCIPPRTTPWRDFHAFLMDFDLCALARAAPGRWRIRVKPAPHLAIRNFDATRYWAGSIDIPVIDLLNTSDAANASGSDEDR